MPESSRVVLRSFPLLCLGIVGLILFCGLVAGAGSSLPTDQPAEGLTVADSTALSESTAVVNGSTAVTTNTTFVVQLQPDGDARWEVIERFNVTTQQQQQVFEELAADFESGSVDGRNLGFDAFVEASELVDAETDRDIAIVDEERTSRVENNTAALTLSFTWEAFARTEGNRLYMDDVFVTESGLWFKQLGPNQRLSINSPQGFGFADASIRPENGSLRWEGPVQFSQNSFQAALVGLGGGTVTPTDTPTPTPTPAPDPGTGGEGGALSYVSGPIGLVFIGLGAVGLLFIGAMMASGSVRLREAIAGFGTRKEESAEQEAETSPEQTAASNAEPEEEVDLELLSDEERVERLLEQNGGRMKQATIVKETGWSNAKVSQLLSAMEEDDRIDKLRIGRENLISFPEEDITDIGNK